jgi:queuine tRNA-ribosyltransferase
VGNFEWTLQKQEERARAGVFSTPHGDIHTPVFAPVGTQATVKALTPVQVADTGASLILANTYHLSLRPGSELVAAMGGLHAWMGWRGPILTDSGGFQVFSLRAIRQMDEEGVTFKSHIDGSLHRLTPESAISIQEQLGADIMMALDDCPPPKDRETISAAVRRTSAWARRCRDAQQRADQALFGIVQGGIYPDLREQSATDIMRLNFPGYAIGGLSVGESKRETYAVLDCLQTLLPADKPRYLMGVGSPADLVEGVARGIDMFDCVLPTRLARHHAAILRHGRINMAGAQMARDPRPIDPACDCYACAHFSRSYIRHLVLAKEILAATLITIHNVRLLVRLMEEMRGSILENRFGVLWDEFRMENKRLEG